MSKVVIGVERGANPDQIYDVWMIGEAFAARGHQVCYVVPEPLRLAELGGPDARLETYQSPILSDPPQLITKTPKIGGLADSMALQGYAESFQLRNLAAIWSRQLSLLRPDIIVGLSAPVLWLVGPKFVPTFVVGDGYALPPIVNRAFLRSSPDITPVVAQDVMVENANVVLHDLEMAPVARLTEVIERCSVCHYGLSHFDPYLPHRQKPSLGILGYPALGDVPDVGRRLALFLDVHYPNIEALLVALAGTGTVVIDLFLSGATLAMRNYLSMIPAVTVWDDFNAALWRASAASAVVHHGVPLLAAYATVLGTPQLLLPWTNDQMAVRAGLDILGVTWMKEPSVDIRELSEVLRGLHIAQGLRTKARHHARQLSQAQIPDALAMIVDLGEAATRPSSRPDRSNLTKLSVKRSIADEITRASSEPVLDRAVDPVAASTGTFCALPWHHMCFSTEGTAKICCMSRDYVSENGTPMSLYTNTFDEIWNSDYMCNVRRDMAEGKKIEQCETCYSNELATGHSYRTTTGLKPLDNETVSPQALKSVGDANSYHVDSSPGYIKLELGNLCNLKCRMCYGGNSSEIERDPVHLRWNGGDEPLHSVWQGNVATIGPWMRIGIARSGIHAPRVKDGQACCWTDGHATFDFPISPRSSLVRLDIEFLAGDGQAKGYEVRVNGATVSAGQLKPKQPSVSIDLSGRKIGRSAKVEIISETTIGRDDSRRFGLPLVAIKVYRKPVGGDGAAAGAEVINSKLGGPGLWYNDDRLIFEEVFRDISRLRRLYVTGGEPFLEPRFAQILDYLIEQGVAGNVDLELSTNGTRLAPEMVAKLTQFKSLLALISLDGTGDVFEYMRFPGRWSKVRRNVRMLKELAPKANICAVPVLQAYNVLNAVEICRFCDEIGIEFSFTNILQVPERLTIDVLPRSVRILAGKRLRDYAETECRPQARDRIETLSHFLESSPGEPSPAQLREFMVFTNDLDRSRGQSIRKSLPELVAIIEAAGTKWIDDTYFADLEGERRPARERLHAWV